MPISVSSAKGQSLFEGLSLRNAAELIKTLESSSLTNRHYLKEKYLESAQHFDEIVQYLACLDIISLKNGEIGKSKNFEKVISRLNKGEDEFFQHLIFTTVMSDSPYSEELKAFIREFEPSQSGKLILKRLAPGDLAFAVRNFLIKVDTVKLNYSSGLCTLGGYLEEIYLRLERNEAFSPEELEAVLVNQAKIGLSAEESVMEYEKSQAGESLEHLVQHVAKFNTAAGFDIYSVRPGNGEIGLRLYIEVKAVSPTDYKFYWSRNEQLTAEKYSASYYLYLVPVINGKPCTEQMVIIPNPAMNLLEKGSEWELTAELLECKKRVKS